MFGSASAHPGRTDANGGHYDSSTGEYHYHHGYPAHQHTNGICPYDFDDQTGWNSGTSSNSSGGNRKESPPIPEIPFESEQEDIPLWGWLLLGLFALIMATVVLDIISSAIDDWRRKKAEKVQRAQRYEKERQNYIDMYGGKSAEMLSGVPSDTEIGSDGLPKEKGADGWGKKYTVYRSRTGKVFHRAGCNPAATIPVHVFTVSSLKPCKKCKPELPNKQWFIEYSRIKYIKNKYKIP